MSPKPIYPHLFLIYPHPHFHLNRLSSQLTFISINFHLNRLSSQSTLAHPFATFKTFSLVEKVLSLKTLIPKILPPT